MRKFLMNMPSYQEMVNESKQSSAHNKSFGSGHDRNCTCRDVLLVDSDSFSILPLQIMIKHQDSRGADEAKTINEAFDLLEEKIKSVCFCGRDSYDIILIDLEIGNVGQDGF